MGIMYWVRVGFMAVALCAVVYAIRYMNRTPPAATPVAKFIVGTGESEKFVLCPTRVVALQTSDGLEIRQEKMRWMRATHPSGEGTELNTISVEKWFGHNCSISGQATTTGQNFRPVLTLTYVNGTSAVLERAPSGEFQLNDHRFLSHDLSEALRTLADLPVVHQD